MIHLPKLLRHAGMVLLSAGVIAGAAPAQEARFSVMLGQRQIGTLNYAPGALRTSTTNAPLGIGNGNFTAALKPVQDASGAKRLGYSGHSKSSRENRMINIVFDGAIPLETKVTPESEMTDMSDPSRVTGRVLDPIRAFGAMLNVKSCPAAITLYDGRRVAQVSTTPAAAADGTLRCEGQYRVLAGAAHVNPLGIRRAGLGLTYVAQGGGYALQRMDLHAGPVTVAFTR